LTDKIKQLSSCRNGQQQIIHESHLLRYHLLK
jgi:hypothetical protein